MFDKGLELKESSQQVIKVEHPYRQRFKASFSSPSVGSSSLKFLGMDSIYIKWLLQVFLNKDEQVVLHGHDIAYARSDKI